MSVDCISLLSKQLHFGRATVTGPDTLQEELLEAQLFLFRCIHVVMTVASNTSSQLAGLRGSENCFKSPALLLCNKDASFFVICVSASAKWVSSLRSRPISSTSTFTVGPKPKSHGHWFAPSCSTELQRGKLQMRQKATLRSYFR